MTSLRESLRQQYKQREHIRQSFHTAQAELLETAFRADLAVIQVLAARLGRDIYEIVRLRDQVLMLLPVPVRLKLLREIMDEESWSDDFPFVLPVLERLFATRNMLAHSVTAAHFEAEGDEGWSFTRTSYRRSGQTSETFALSKLTYITKAAERVLLDLDFIWVRCMPQSFWFDKSVE